MKNYRLHACEKIKDLKELVKRSSDKYKNRDAFRIKTAEGAVRGISYKELYKDVEALGTAMMRLGILKSHVAVTGDNCYEWVVTYLAVVNGGAVIVPIDKELPESEIANIIKQSDSGTVVYSEALEPVIRSLQPQLPQLKCCIGMQKKTAHGCFKSFTQLIQYGRKLLEQGYTAYKDTVTDPEKMCVILYTSGTTGNSKGVMLSHKNLASVIWGAMSTIRVESVAMSVLPIHHTYECTCGILTAIYGGVTVCFCDSLKHVSENLLLFRPKMLILVPLFVEAMYKKIWDKAKKTGVDRMLKLMIKLSNALRKLRIDLRSLFFRRVRAAFGGRLTLIVSGGAPLRAELVTGFDELGIKVLNGYGITECSPLVSVNRNRYYKEDSVGVVVPCCEVRINEPDENGEGEILVKGENVMLGYYKNEAETVNAFLNGWFKTGDIGRIDDEGFLHVTGRIKNTIVLSTGKNVQPEELEEYLMGKMPYIREVVVYSEEKEEGEETAISAAFVFDKEYIEENGIKNPEALIKADFHKANRLLPTYKQISRFTCQYEEFEKTTTKKIKRFKVRK